MSKRGRLVEVGRVASTLGSPQIGFAWFFILPFFAIAGLLWLNSAGDGLVFAAVLLALLSVVVVVWPLAAVRVHRHTDLVTIAATPWIAGLAFLGVIACLIAGILLAVVADTSWLAFVLLAGILALLPVIVPILLGRSVGLALSRLAVVIAMAMIVGGVLLGAFSDDRWFALSTTGLVLLSLPLITPALLGRVVGLAVSRVIVAIAGAAIIVGSVLAIVRGSVWHVLPIGSIFAAMILLLLPALLGRAVGLAMSRILFAAVVVATLVGATLGTWLDAGWFGLSVIGLVAVMLPLIGPIVWRQSGTTYLFAFPVITAPLFPIMAFGVAIVALIGAAVIAAFEGSIVAIIMAAILSTMWFGLFVLGRAMAGVVPWRRWVAPGSERAGPPGLQGMFLVLWPFIGPWLVVLVVLLFGTGFPGSLLRQGHDAVELSAPVASEPRESDPPPGNANATATATPAPSSTPGATATVSPTVSPTATTQPSPTPDPTPTRRPSVETQPAAAVRFTPTPTVTPTAGPTPIPTMTPTAVPTPTPTATVTAEIEAPTIGSAAGLPGSTPNPTLTATSTPQPTPTPPPSPTATPLPTPTTMATATATPVPTATALPDSTPTATATPSPEPSPTATATATTTGSAPLWIVMSDGSQYPAWGITDLFGAITYMLMVSPRGEGCLLIPLGVGDADRWGDCGNPLNNLNSTPAEVPYVAADGTVLIRIRSAGTITLIDATTGAVSGAVDIGTAPALAPAPEHILLGKTFGINARA